MASRDSINLGTTDFQHRPASSINSTGRGRVDVATMFALAGVELPASLAPQQDAPAVSGPDLAEEAPNATVTGGSGADTLSGTPMDDRISGFGGDDMLFGRDGNDGIFGGTGNDFVVGGNGNDSINGAVGNDTLGGNNGDDVIFSNAGDDVIVGGAGNDTAVGGAGNDNINGGAGEDRLFGNNGDDVLNGGAGNDTMLGGAGNDNLDGGAGDDALRGGTGADMVTGGSGADRFFVSNANESAVGSEDTILDFSSAEGDRIDLRGLNNEVAGGGSLSFGGAETENTSITTTGGTTTADVLANAVDGNSYLNFHTVANPGGEVRGQLVLVEDNRDANGLGTVVFSTTLSGANEVPPVATDASGSATVTFTVSAGTVSYDLQVDISNFDMDDLAAGHFHNGMPGENGPIVENILTDEGTTVSGSTTFGFTGTAGEVIFDNGQTLIDLDGDSVADVAINVTSDMPLMASDVLI